MSDNPQEQTPDIAWMRVVVAEIFGTFILIGASLKLGLDSASQKMIAGDQISPLISPLVTGTVLVVLVYALLPISGSHFNPAVTFGFACAKKIPFKAVPFYILSQLIGACLACIVLGFGYGKTWYEGVSMTMVKPVADISVWDVYWIEGGAAAIFVFIAASTTDGRFPKAAAGITVGLGLLTAILLAISETGGSVNPARAGATMVLMNDYPPYAWGYILGPLVGGVVGAGIFAYVQVAQKPEV